MASNSHAFLITTNMITRIGVAIILQINDHILLGNRIDGTWGLPGGKVEIGEDLYTAIRRETYEETGINMANDTLSIIGSSSTIIGDTHWITIIFKSDKHHYNPIVAEPDKIKKWRYFGVMNLPDNIFEPLLGYLKSDEALTNKYNTKATNNGRYSYI
jgi:8-oxo-dGTP pyrophosphatase MutT (NUDIX family)